MLLKTDTSILKPSYLEEGYIYCIVNKSYKGWIKVGMSQDPKQRLKTGYNAYAPEDNFYFLKLQKVAYYKLAEKYLIEIFSKYTSGYSKGEWFQTTQAEAKKYFSETVNTLEEYVHRCCIQEKVKKQQKKEYSEKKNREAKISRERKKVLKEEFNLKAKEWLINFDKRWNQFDFDSFLK